MSTMKAVRIESYGSADVLRFGDAPRPKPSAGEILVQVKATSVNPFDCAARAGYMHGYFNYAFPLILGLDAAGVVAEVGAGVTQFKIGDQVYARLNPARNGGYAEFALASAGEAAAKPKTLDFVQAAAVPHVALTAQSMIDAASLANGQTVLIHGAAGGVGHVAVQLAHLLGAKVIGTASAANQSFLKELGVDVAVDYNASPFESIAHGVDAVFDTIGGETQARSWATLKPGGILVSIVQPPSQEAADAVGARLAFAGFMGSGGELLAKFAGLIDAGKLKIKVSHTLPLAEAQSAHTLVEARHTQGKVALAVA